MFLIRYPLALIAAFFCLTASALAQDKDSSAPLPAVSELNGKLDFEGGSIDGNSDFIFRGTVTAPIGDRFGFQVDAELGRFVGSTRAGVGSHLFYRNPEQFLLGIYGSYHTWEDINISRFGVEGEVYWNNVTFSGLAGYEWLDVPRTKGGLAVLNKDSVDPFAALDFSLYLKDNTRVTIGYNYEAQQSFATVGFETLLQNAKVPTSLYANAKSNFDGTNSIHAGFRFHLGADPDKTLIRRHREDDPQAYSPVFPTLRTQAPETEPGTGTGTGPPPMQCDAGFKVCRDGSRVFRDPINGCAFRACPGEGL